jgi:uncharacterized protein
VTVRSIHIETAQSEDFAPAADRVVHGSPRGETRNAYESADGQKYFGAYPMRSGNIAGYWKDKCV